MDWFAVFPGSQVTKPVAFFEYFQVHRSSTWIIFSIFPAPQPFRPTDDPKINIDFTCFHKALILFHMFGPNFVSSLLNTNDITGCTKLIKYHDKKI